MIRYSRVVSCCCSFAIFAIAFGAVRNLTAAEPAASVNDGQPLPIFAWEGVPL